MTKKKNGVEQIAFERRVERLWIDPARSQHFTVRDGKVVEYKPPPDCISPAGLYPAVIVPERLVGRVVQIKPEEESKNKKNKKRLRVIEMTKKRTEWVDAVGRKVKPGELTWVLCDEREDAPFGGNPCKTAGLRCWECARDGCEECGGLAFEI